MAISFFNALSNAVSGTLDEESTHVLLDAWNRHKEAFQLLSKIISSESTAWQQPLVDAKNRVSVRSVESRLQECEHKLTILDGLFSHPEGCLIQPENYIELLEEGERLFASEARYEKARTFADRAMQVRRQLLSSPDLDYQKRAETLLRAYIQTDLQFLAA